MMDGEPTRVILAGLQDALLGLAMRGSILFGLAFLVTRVVRSLGPERRHTVWLAVILVLAILPVAQVALPHVRIPLLDWLPAGQDNRPVPEAPSASRGLPAPGRPQPAGAGDPRCGVPAPWVLFALGGIWAAGAAAVAGRPIAGRLALRRVVRAAGPPARVPEALARRVSALRAVVLSHPRVTVPFTFGVRNPAILLPPSWISWNRGKLDAVLFHELAHLRRRDALSDAAVQAACVLLWFVPFVWIARVFVSREAELSCDREVLSRGISRSSYAETLVQIARQARGVSVLAGSALAGTSLLRQRITRILLPGPSSRPSSAARARAAAAVLCAATALVLLSVSLRVEDPLPGVWLGRAALMPSYDYRLALNPDGTGQTSLDALPDVPTAFCRYVVQRRWRDSQGYLCYHLRVRWSDTPFVVYQLVRLDPAGTFFEMADSPTGYPEGFLGPLGSEKHLLYTRR